MAGLEEQLSLDVSPALDAIANIDRALTAVVDAFSANLAAALDILAAPPSMTIPVDTNTAEADADLGRLADTPPIDLPVDTETGAAEADLAQLHDAAPIDLPVDTQTAEAEADLARLADTDITVPVDVDTSQGEAEVQAFVGQADIESINIPVNVDTGSASEDLGEVGQAAQGAGSDVNFLELAAADMTDQFYNFAKSKVTGGVKGSLDEVAKAGKGVGEGGEAAAAGLTATTVASGAVLGAVGGYTAALGKALDIGTEVIASQQQFNETFGASAKVVEDIDVLGLNTSLQDLAVTLGTDDEAMQDVASRTGALLQAFGATQAESAEMTKDIAAMSAGISAANPALGDMTTVMTTLTTAIATGRLKGLRRLGIEIEPEEIEEHARALGKTTESLTAVEKQTILVQIAMEKVGNVSDDVAARQENAAVIMASMRERFSNLMEAISAPVAVPLLNAIQSILPLLESLEPLATRFGEAWAKYITLTTRMWAVQLQAIGRIVQVAANLIDVVDAIPGIGHIVPDGLVGELHDVANAALGASTNMFVGADGADAMEAALTDVVPPLHDLVEENENFRDALYNTHNSLQQVAAAVTGTRGEFSSMIGDLRKNGDISEENARKLSELRQEYAETTRTAITLAEETGGITEEQANQIQQMPSLLQQNEALADIMEANAVAEEHAAAAEEAHRVSLAKSTTAWADLTAAILSGQDIDIGAWAAQLNVDVGTISSRVGEVTAAWQSFAQGVIDSANTSSDVLADWVADQTKQQDAYMQSLVDRGHAVNEARDQLVQAQQEEAAAGESGSQRVQDAMRNLAKVDQETAATVAENKAAYLKAFDPAELIERLQAQAEAVRTWRLNIQVLIDEGLVNLAARSLELGAEVGGGVAQGLVNSTPEMRLAAEMALVDTTKAATTEMLDWLNGLPAPTRASLVAAANAGEAGWTQEFNLVPGTKIELDATGRAIGANAPTGAAGAAGGATGSSFTGGFAVGVANPATGIPSKWNSINELFGVRAASGVMLTAQNSGEQIANSMLYGMQLVLAGVPGHDRYLNNTITAMERMVLRLIEAARRVAGISSPSKVFADMGGQMVAGLAQGLSSTSAVTQAGRSLMNAAVGTGSFATAGGRNIAGVQFNIVVNLASGSPADAQRAGRLLAESAERTLVRRGVIARVRTGG